MKIIHKNVTEQLVAYFIQKIESGEWVVGEKIPSENRLTAELGVSRASVRQAVSQLAGVGVFETVHGKGTFLLDDQVQEAIDNENRITANDCKDVEKVLEFRRIVECEACYIAAQKQTSALLRKLEHYITSMKNNKENTEKFINADIGFHQAICRAAENPLLEKVMNKVFAENRRSQQLTRKAFGYKDGILYHEKILKAMREKNPSAARTAMYEHLQNGIKRIQELK